MLVQGHYKVLYKLKSVKSTQQFCHVTFFLFYHWTSPWDPQLASGNFITSFWEIHLSKVSKKWEHNEFLQINNSREVALVMLWETLKPVHRGNIIVSTSDKKNQWSVEVLFPKDAFHRRWKQSTESLKQKKLLLNCSEHNRTELIPALNENLKRYYRPSKTKLL